MSMSRHCSLAATSLLTLLSVTRVGAQTELPEADQATDRVAERTADSGYPLFADNAPLALRLTAPFRELTRSTERTERTEHPAVVELAGEEDGRAVAMEVRVRGRSRLANCDFPPLSLDFPKDAVADTIFAGQNRLKLVTLCKRLDTYRDYLALEYLIYRFFNALTDRSFRVRWVSVEYVYTDTRRPTSMVEHAFLIEDDREVAERLGMQVVEQEQLTLADLDPSHTALLTLFHFMIGNTDFSVVDAVLDEPCCHNGKVVVTAEGTYLVLPYDFDQAGLINTEYSVPHESLPIGSVRERYFRGFCPMNAELETAAAILNRQRAVFGSGLGDDLIRARSLERAIRYLDRSFEIINDAEEFREEVYESCK